MTKICYIDLTTNSSDGEYTLEARSPHNGTINYKNGVRRPLKSSSSNGANVSVISAIDFSRTSTSRKTRDHLKLTEEP